MEDSQSSCICRLRGLPYGATEGEISDFFAGFGVRAVHICRRAGRATGEAFVEFPSRQDSDRALSGKNNHNLQHRYIEIFEVPGSDLAAMQRSSSTEAQLQGYVLRLRGLPFTATAADVVRFFEGIELARGASGVVFTCTADGRPLGEAYVELASEEAQQAALKRHKNKMGSRYIELFHSSKGDLLQAIQQHGFYTDQPDTVSRDRAVQSLQQDSDFSRLASPSNRSQGEVRTGSDTLRLRGLPYSAGVDEITEFFSGFSLAPRGVHILSKTDRSGSVQSMGIAYVQFKDSSEAERARATKHRAHMGTRYIECLAYQPDRFSHPPPVPPPHAVRAVAMAMAQPSLVHMPLAQTGMVPLAIGMQPPPPSLRQPQPGSSLYLHQRPGSDSQLQQISGGQGSAALRRARANGRGGRGSPLLSSEHQQQQMLMQQQYMLQQQMFQQQQLMSQVSMPGYDSQRWRGHGSTMPATGQIAPGMGHLSPSIGSHWYSSSLANSGSVNIGPSSHHSLPDPGGPAMLGSQPALQQYHEQADRQLVPAPMPARPPLANPQAQLQPPDPAQPASPATGGSPAAPPATTQTRTDAYATAQAMLVATSPPGVLTPPRTAALSPRGAAFQPHAEAQPYTAYSAAAHSLSPSGLASLAAQKRQPVHEAEGSHVASTATQPQQHLELPRDLTPHSARPSSSSR